MKNTFKGTKEEVFVDDFDVCRKDQPYTVAQCYDGSDSHISDMNMEIARANAQLFAEALNTVNQTGYTPKQLAEQKAELLDACIKAEKHHQGGHSEIGALLRTVITNANL